MPSFATKQAGISDIPIIKQIQQKTWEPTYRDILSKEQIEYMYEKIYSTEALEESILIYNHQFFLISADNEPVGFASVSPEGTAKFKLQKIYVLPSMQGTGAGKFLLDEVEKYVRSAGGSKLLLNVNRYNKARSFYEKMNFSIVREEDIAIGPYWMNDYVLEKDLE